jgi:hypothetical protein
VITHLTVKLTELQADDIFVGYDGAFNYVISTEGPDKFGCYVVTYRAMDGTSKFDRRDRLNDDGLLEILRETE